jgi:hypothetical protein
MTTSAPTATTVRLLPPDEFPRLADYPLAEQHGVPDPRSSGTSRVASQLLHGMKAQLSSLNLVHSFTMIAHDTPEVLILAQKAGFQLLPMHLCFLDLTRPEGDV